MLMDGEKPGNEQVSLRERKKRLTYQAVSEAAIAMFLERGFDKVSVAEVAAAADISKPTLFRYFPAKEDLVLHRFADHEDEAARVVAARADTESPWTPCAATSWTAWSGATRSPGSAMCRRCWRTSASCTGRRPWWPACTPIRAARRRHSPVRWATGCGTGWPRARSSPYCASWPWRTGGGSTRGERGRGVRGRGRVGRTRLRAVADGARGTAVATGPGGALRPGRRRRAAPLRRSPVPGPG